MLAIVAPGQGAQTPGFLSPWLTDSALSDLLDQFAAASDLDLRQLGTAGDEETIRDTKVAQPLLVAAGLMASAALTGAGTDLTSAGVVAGHSVGELTAAAAAGVLTPDQAMTLVAERGRAMAEAAAATPTSMTAVIGGKPEEVVAAIEAAGLTPANNNGRGQVVAAGTVEQLAAFAENPPTRTRLFPLSVAGAFHTVHMEPAVQRLADLAESITPQEPRVPLLSNADGTAVADGADALSRIVGQVANPVRWDLCMATMAELGVTGLLELPPAGTLTGIAKRNLRGVDVFNLDTPDQLADAAQFISTHASGTGATR